MELAISWPTLVATVSVSVFLFAWLKMDIRELRTDMRELKVELKLAYKKHNRRKEQRQTLSRMDDVRHLGLSKPRQRTSHI